VTERRRGRQGSGKKVGGGQRAHEAAEKKSRWLRHVADSKGVAWRFFSRTLRGALQIGSRRAESKEKPKTFNDESLRSRGAG